MSTEKLWLRSIGFVDKILIGFARTKLGQNRAFSETGLFFEFSEVLVLFKRFRSFTGILRKSRNLSRIKFVVKS